MSEITKLYENAGIAVPIARLKIFEDDNGKIYIKPPFTAEKQIELIKFLIKEYNYYLDVIDTNNFESSLTETLNDLWQDLTSEEKQQIKEILE